MYYIEKVHDDIYWVGVNDRRIQRFENMFPLSNGVAYNSYLIKDEKTVLMDSVDGNFVNQFLENVDAALDGRDLDYIVVQHMEPDHCGTINFILDKYPNCKFVGNLKTFKFFEQFYSNKYTDRYVEIKEFDTLNTGKHNLKFLFAPMVHWPEVIMTYDLNDKLLFSADAFGAFDVHQGNLSVKNKIDDPKWMDEARRYYINIVGRQGRSVQAVFKKLNSNGINEFNSIFSLHGPIFNDSYSISVILDKYNLWSTYQPEEKGVVIVFSSMYGNMELFNDILATKLADLGVENIRMHDVSQTDFSYIIADLHKYSNAVLTAQNYNSELYPRMDALLREANATGYSNRHISFLHTGTWGGKSLEYAQEILQNKNHTFIGEPVKIKSSAKKEDIDNLYNLAKLIEEDINN